ncbi:hypothetical protein IE81DRAFT_365022 [Ceraceosorus guamensis]|uniref:Sterol regulatory element-binding protein cleavage-activating protein n=1 Tax=Ceraceosorus guamensis TaxID=1522189 RepID=A0A316W6A0_9BASI|nr:hypothetical protein IE81DRAFT_365022 [Ceraceosorus guamensis]PWN44271.1 hypothetical protein IE81DRAFT_365022 [Ceraceosorus guamensis]
MAPSADGMNSSESAPRRRADSQLSPPPTPTIMSLNQQSPVDKGEGPSRLAPPSSPRKSSVSRTGAALPIEAFLPGSPASSPTASMRLSKSGLGSLASHHALYPPQAAPQEAFPRARRRPKRSSQRKEMGLPVIRNVSRLSAKISARVERLFRKHGANVSRHPIRTLLLCCLLITSLFYPAAGIYLWSSQGGPGISRSDTSSVWRTLSTPLLDSFASSGRTHHNSLRDLRMVWDDAADLFAQDPRDWMPERHKARPPKCARLEHVLFTTDDVMRGEAGRRGVLEAPVLNSAYRLQSALETRLKSVGGENTPRCIQNLSGACLTLGPLDYWPEGSFPLKADAQASTELLASSVNQSARGVPVSLETTLAGRSHMFARNPRAEFLAFSFWLEQAQCGNTTGNEHVNFRALLSDIAIGTRIVESEHQTAKSVLVRFAPDKRTPRAHQIMLALGYLGFLLYIGRGLVRMRKVHSRFGLAFTGFTELLISMIMSVSICALCGVRLTAVPWEILPFVIVVVGSENMFVLANAIVSTPISLSVASRVAAGLGAAGVSIAVTVLSDVLLLSAIAMLVHVAAVREFCIFAICSLLVDFVMQMTFFVTVFSIDLQRLELADLLAQGVRSVEQDRPLAAEQEADASAAQATALSTRRVAHKEEQRTGSFIRMSCRAVWRARTARTASLSILLAAMFGLYLYYGTGYQSQDLYGPSLPFADIHGVSASLPTRSTLTSAPRSSNAETRLEPTDGVSDPFDPLGHLSAAESSSSDAAPWWMDSPSASFWMSLNPDGAPHVRVAVEPWSIVSLRSAKGATPQHTRKLPFASWALFRPRIRAIIWFLKLSVLPIGGTTGLLWILLLYLLKDTELLDAQRDKGTISEEEGESDVSRSGTNSLNDDSIDVSLTALTGVHATDIILTDADGSYIASVGIDSSIIVWDTKAASRKVRTHRITVQSLGGTDTTAVTCVELSASDELLAVGQRSGFVTIYSLASQQVTHRWQPTTGPVQLVTFSRSAMRELRVTSAHRDGSVWTWLDAPAPQCEPSVQPRLDTSWTAQRFHHSSCYFALSAPNRQIEVYHIGTQGVAPVSTIPGPANGLVRSLTSAAPGHQGLAPESGVSSFLDDVDVVLSGTSTGTVQAWQLSTGNLIGQTALADGPVQDLFCISDHEQRNQPYETFAAVTQAKVTILRLSNGQVLASTMSDLSPGAPTSSASRPSPPSSYRRTASETSVSGATSTSLPRPRHGSRPPSAGGSESGHELVVGRPRAPKGSSESGSQDQPEIPTHFDNLTVVMCLPCHRGSAVVLRTSGDSSRLAGVRRRRRSEETSTGTGDSRGSWEYWELECAELSEKGSSQSLKVRTCPIDLERLITSDERSPSSADSDSDEDGSRRLTPHASRRIESRKIHVAARGPNALLSFARVSLIKSVIPVTGFAERASDEALLQSLAAVRERRRSLVIAFGNSLARLSIASPPHPRAGTFGSVSSATAFAMHPAYDRPSSTLMRRRRSRFE